MVLLAVFLVHGGGLVLLPAMVSFLNVDDYKARGTTLATIFIATLVASTAHVSKYAVLGAGTVVMHQAFVNAGAVIGENVIINTFANIEHDAHIGNQCHISTGTMVNGDCVVGDNCFIGSNCNIVALFTCIMETVYDCREFGGFVRRANRSRCNDTHCGAGYY